MNEIYLRNLKNYATIKTAQPASVNGAQPNSAGLTLRFEPTLLWGTTRNALTSNYTIRRLKYLWQYAFTSIYIFLHQFT